MNKEMHAAISIPLRVGIGIHTGPVIMARVGDEARGYRMTALGETVTIAHRLEEATKRQLTDCLVSQETLRAAGAMGEISSRHDVNIPGRTEPVVAFGLEAEVNKEAKDAVA
jgi:adenylate cyclase